MLIFSCISLCAWLHAFSYKCIFVCMVSLNKWGIKNSTYCTTAKTTECLNNSFFIIKDTCYPDALCKDQIQGQIKISNYDINFLELHSSPFQTFEIFFLISKPGNAEISRQYHFRKYCNVCLNKTDPISEHHLPASAVQRDTKYEEDYHFVQWAVMDTMTALLWHV